MALPVLLATGGITAGTAAAGTGAAVGAGVGAGAAGAGASGGFLSSLLAGGAPSTTGLTTNSILGQSGSIGNAFPMQSPSLLGGGPPMTPKFVPSSGPMANMYQSMTGGAKQGLGMGTQQANPIQGGMQRGASAFPTPQVKAPNMLPVQNIMGKPNLNLNTGSTPSLRQNQSPFQQGQGGGMNTMKNFMNNPNTGGQGFNQYAQDNNQGLGQLGEALGDTDMKKGTWLLDLIKQTGKSALAAGANQLFRKKVPDINVPPEYATAKALAELRGKSFMHGAGAIPDSITASQNTTQRNAIRAGKGFGQTMAAISMADRQASDNLNKFLLGQRQQGIPFLQEASKTGLAEGQTAMELQILANRDAVAQNTMNDKYSKANAGTMFTGTNPYDEALEARNSNPYNMFTT